MILYHDLGLFSSLFARIDSVMAALSSFHFVPNRIDGGGGGGGRRGGNEADSGKSGNGGTGKSGKMES